MNTYEKIDAYRLFLNELVNNSDSPDFNRDSIEIPEDIDSYDFRANIDTILTLIEFKEPIEVMKSLINTPKYGNIVRINTPHIFNRTPFYM